MIYCSTNNIRKVSGNLGNMIMRIMSMIGFAEKYNTTWAIPFWEYADYFENKIRQIHNHEFISDISIREPNFHYTPDYYNSIDWQKNIDLQGFFQSPKYWTTPLQLKENYLKEIKSKYDFSNNPIAISVRRGDMVNHKCYYQIHPVYYPQALTTHFKDYENRDIFIFSDDISYCRNHYNFNSRTFFIEAKDIEQFAVMTLCSDFIISQSTFSYMAAYLSKNGKVIRPVLNFSEEYGKINNEKDYWPELNNWIIFNPS